MISFVKSDCDARPKRATGRFAPWFFLILSALWVLSFTGCQGRSPGKSGKQLQGDLTIFHAGSLTVPVDRLTDAFHRQHPGVRFRTEAAGSRTTARKVSELGRQADLVMSADYEVIDTLLIPEYASWNVLFARNAMVIAYTENSRYGGEIHGENWHRILLRDDVEFGHSDPNADPNGYRTLMVWQLAEDYYQEPGLYDKLDRASPPRNVRPKETDLIALLQTGDLDYAFNYHSVAVQHQLLYVDLPDALDLSKMEFAETYRGAQVDISGSAPGKKISRRGKPIIYGVTIPDHAPHPELAAAFLEFLFSPQGQRILEEEGQPPLTPPVSYQRDRLPDALMPLVQAGQEN